MTVRPIIFSAPMVRAILEGRKTQTRRILSPANCTVLGNRARGRKDPLWAGLDFSRATIRTQSTLMVALCGQDAPYDLHLRVPWRHPDDPAAAADDCFYRVRPIYAPGDLLWVRETWAESAHGPVYKADVLGADTDGWGWRPSIHMPRWASRITLEVTAVRLQRLQEIVADDAIAEGIDSVADNFGNGPAYCDYELPRLYDTAEWFASPIDSFASLWRSIYGPGAWEENPEVVAVTFRPHLCNIDEWSKAA